MPVQTLREPAEAASLPGSDPVWSERSEFQQSKPMRMAFTSTRHDPPTGRANRFQRRSNSGT